MPLIDSFLHPATGFFILGLILVLPFFRGRSWRWVLFLPPVLAIFLSLRMHMGSYWVVSYVGQDLVLGRVDPLSFLFVILFAILSLICTTFAYHVHDKTHHVASLFFMGASFGCLLAGDYWTLYIFWQFMTVSSAFLIWLSGRPRSAEAGFRYMLVLLLSSVLLLAGILLRERATGTFVFGPAESSMMHHYDWLILAAFCINAAVVPMHAWLTDAYPESTIPGAVFLSVFTVKTAIYALTRCFVGLEVLFFLGAVMALYGAFFALTTNNIRRALAYLMVSQGGFIVCGIGMDTEMALNGAMTMAYANTFYNALLFMAAGSLLYVSGEEHLSRLGGLAKSFPKIVVLYLIGALSMSCMPFLNGFVGTPMILEALWQQSPVPAFALVVALAGTFLAVGLRIPWFAFKSGEAKEKKPHRRVPLNMLVAMVMAAAFCVIQGLFPHLLYRLLPFPVEGSPFALWKVFTALVFLCLVGVTFIPFRKVLVPGNRRLPDFDFLYRLVGRGVLFLFSRPLAWMDGIWTNVYQTVFVRAAVGTARSADSFDREGIDRVVEGTARSVLGLGRISAGIQTGRLQEQLAWMVILALGLFALIWFW